jgi:hypothetical protein
MHPIVEHLMTAYPSPVPARLAYPEGSRPEQYCVGGSLCLSYPDAVPGFRPRPFPAPNDLADWLMALNAALDDTAAMDFAARITHNNDASCFARAYQVLDQALTYRKE